MSSQDATPTDAAGSPASSLAPSPRIGAASPAVTTQHERTTSSENQHHSFTAQSSPHTPSQTWDQNAELNESADHIGHLAERSDATLYSHPNHSSTSTAPPSSWVARLTGRNRSSSVDSPPTSHFTFPARTRTNTAAGLAPASGQLGPDGPASNQAAHQPQPQIIVSSSNAPVRNTPSQPRTRLSLSRLSISRSGKGSDNSRLNRPPTSSGIAQSSLNEPHGAHTLQRTLSVNEMRADPSASNENLSTDAATSAEKQGGRRRLFNRSPNTSSSSIRSGDQYRRTTDQGAADKPLPPPSASGKARQILRYLDGGGGGRNASSSKEWDLSSIQGSNMSSDTIASTNTTDMRRRSGDSTFANSVAGSIPAWARRIGKSNKPPSIYGGASGSPGANYPPSSPILKAARPGRGDREVSPAFSDDSNAEGRIHPSHLSVSTHSGSDSAGAHSASGRGLQPPATAIPTAATSASSRPTSMSATVVPSTSRFSLPLPGSAGLERAFRFFMDPDASASSTGKGGIGEQQGIWLLGVWHGPTHSEAQPSPETSAPAVNSGTAVTTPNVVAGPTPLEPASGVVTATATPAPPSAHRHSPAASIKRGSISSQSRGSDTHRLHRNPSSDALNSPGTSAPSSFSARSSPEKVLSKLPPTSVSSGSMSNRSSIDHASASSGASRRQRTQAHRFKLGETAVLDARRQPLSREGSASVEGTDTEQSLASGEDRASPSVTSDASHVVLPSPPTTQSATRAERQAAIASAQAAISGTRSQTYGRSSDRAASWQNDFQADFSSRIWCTYRNQFAPIARDGTISLQAEAGPVQVDCTGSSGELQVPPATPNGPNSAAGASGPGSSVRQWIGRRLGEGGSSHDLLSVSPSQSHGMGPQHPFASGSPSLASMGSSTSTATVSGLTSPSGTFSKSPSATGNAFQAGPGGGLLSATSSVAGGLGEKMGIPNLWGRATAAAQAVGLTGRAGLTTDAGWGCMLRTGQSLLANALMDIHLGREWRRKESPVAQRIVSLHQALLASSSQAYAAGAVLPLHIAPDVTLLDINDPGYEAKRQAMEEQWQLSKAEYAKYVQLISWFLDDPCLACPFSVHRMAREGKRLGKEVGEWFGPSTAAGAIKQLVSEFPDAGLGVCLAVDQVVYLADVKAAAIDERKGESRKADQLAGRWDRPVLILINIRLGIDCVHPRYYDSVKNIFTFPQSVGISGGRPSSSYYFMGCQENTLFYLDPHNVRPAVPYQPPPRSVRRQGSAQNLSTSPKPQPANLASQTAWQDDWWCQAYSEAQLSTFHCDKVRKMPMKSLDPSMLVGFLVKTPEQLADFCARVKKLPEPIFSVMDSAPQWDAVDDDDELDAAMESFSESSVDADEDQDDSDDSEDNSGDIGFDSGAVTVHEPTSIPEGDVIRGLSGPVAGRSARAKASNRSPLVPSNVGPIQFPVMRPDDADGGDDDALDESSTVGHGGLEPTRRRLSSARKSTARRISGLGRRRVQRQSNENALMAASTSHSAFGPPGRYGSGISSRQTSGASTAREFSFSMPVHRVADASGAGSGNNTEISPSASTERGDNSLHTKVPSDRSAREPHSPGDAVLVTSAEAEEPSSGESGFAEMHAAEADGEGEEPAVDAGYVVAGSLSSDDAESTWSNLSEAGPNRASSQDRTTPGTEVEEDADDDEDQILVPRMSARDSSSSMPPSLHSDSRPTPLSQGDLSRAAAGKGHVYDEEPRLALVSVDSEEEGEEQRGRDPKQPHAEQSGIRDMAARFESLAVDRRGHQERSSNSSASSGRTPSNAH